MNATSVLLLYALSGFISLGYQVCWFRIWVDRFGSTNLTFALVLCNFIGGLGLGALASRRLSDWMLARSRHRDRLAVYGAVELLVTLSVLLTWAVHFLPANLWGDFPYELQGTFFEQQLSYRLSKLAIATLCLFLPCFFMGVTFPLLCDAFRSDGRFPSRLYAWNTLGACSGVLACQFLLFPAIGHGRTFALMAALNALLGLAFLLRGGEREASPAPGTQAPSRSGPSSVWIACAVWSGLLAGTLEGDIFRRVRFITSMDQSAGMAFISFWAILAIFLASSTVHRLPRLRLRGVQLAFVVGGLAYVAAWKLGYPLRELLARPTFDAYQEAFPTRAHIGFSAIFFPTQMSQLFWLAGVFTFPAFFCVSLLLPLACDRLQSSGRHLGLAYGLNTLAFCLAIIAFTWIAPGVSTFYSMKLTFAVFAILTATLALLREGRPLRAWVPGVATLALGAAALWTPAGFDRSYVMPGSPQATHPIRAMRSNGAHTTYVVEEPGGDRLCFDNHSMSSAGIASQVYMRLMAHFPLLAHPEPKRALLICLGVGNTGSAIASHGTLEGLDVVDLNHRVIQTIPEFRATNLGFYEDPRVRLIHDDGRNFLNLTSERYDLVTSEPPPPMMEGVYRLYSRQYYATVLEHLTDGGMMTQWLPVYQMPRGAVDRAVATFLEAFPHTLLFTGAYEEFILMGSKRPIDLARVAATFFADEDVVRSLASIGVHTPEALLSRIVLTDGDLRARYAGGEVIRDEHNDLARLFVDPMEPVLIDYAPRSVLDSLRAQDAELGARMEGILGDLGRVLYQVPDFPYASLARVEASASPEVVGAGVDWLEVGAYLTDLGQARAAGDRKAARRAIGRALNLARSQPALWMNLAELCVQDGDIDGAVESLKLFVEIEPEDPNGVARLGEIYEKVGLHDAAQHLLERAVVARPDDAHLRFTLARSLFALGAFDAAAREARTGLGLVESSARGELDLARPLIASGAGEEALAHLERARKLAPDWPAPWNESARLLAADPGFPGHDPGEALRLAQHAAGLRPRPSPRTLEALALAHRALGQHAQALAAAQRALAACDPNDKSLRASLAALVRELEANRDE